MCHDHLLLQWLIYWNLWTHMEHEKQQEFWFEITLKEIIDGKDNRWCGRQVWKTQSQY